jgi:transcriptional regulator with XRE-family HTH domain
MAEKKVSRDPRMDNRYMARVERFKSLLREWIREEKLTVAEVSRRSGVSPTAIAKILSDVIGERTIAPKLWTMHRLSEPAGIEIEFTRPAKKRGASKRST